MVRTSNILESILRQRVISLVQDNYTIMVKSENPSLYFYKLRHRTNGNVVIIRASVLEDFMAQTTNGKVTYSGIITA